MSKEIKVLITLKSKFVSVNSLYNCRISYIAGRPRAIMYKNPEANRVEEEIRDQLRAVDFSEYIDWFNNTKQYELNLKFILKKSASHKDSSNLIKSLEDIWTRFVKNDLGISDYDDSMHIKVTAEKSYIPDASNEYVLLCLRESKANLRYDIEPKPEKIWISGMTLEEITNILPELPKKLKKKEHYLFASDYDESDTKVYILDVNTISSLDVAKIYKDILMTSFNGYGFVIVGLIGKESDWSGNDLISWLLNEINEYKTSYNGIKLDYIKTKTDIYELIK